MIQVGSCVLRRDLENPTLEETANTTQAQLTNSRHASVHLLVVVTFATLQLYLVSGHVADNIHILPTR